MLQKSDGVAAMLTADGERGADIVLQNTDGSRWDDAQWNENKLWIISVNLCYQLFVGALQLMWQISATSF